MNITDHIACLENAGLITDAQSLRMKQIAAKLPSTQADLLAIIAASSFVNNDAVPQFTQPAIDSELIVTTSASDVKSLGAIPDGATKAILSIHGNNIIFRIDGISPNNSTEFGYFGKKGENIVIGNLKQFKCVADGTDDASVLVSYF